jgi:ABC-type multidrug transport system ATPase subunit
MTDVILSSFISLFALFGKVEHVDEERAKEMLVSYLRHHFGIRNITLYLDLYSDMRMAYEMTDDLDTKATVSSICSALHGKIRSSEEALLLLRLMEFCQGDGHEGLEMFKTMASQFHIPEDQYQDFTDFVENRETDNVLLHMMKGFDGVLKTLFDRHTGLLIFTYMGTGRVLLNDVPVLSGAYQVWLQSSVLKGSSGSPVYYSSIMSAYTKDEPTTQAVEFCGRDINFRFPNSDNGMHNLSFTLRSGELLAIMGGSGTGKTTLLSLLNGSMKPQEGTITINGHDLSEPEAKALIGYVPQDDLLIEELTVYQNLWFTAKLCFEGLSDEEIDRRVMKTLRDLALDATKDLKVGSAINKCISGGQRKRLNIALELIREPAVLFLDEPTSGLSSADTENVINLLKEQTLKGKLIIVNIHQPSSDVYKLFDRLWLLDKGGYPVFDGNPIDAITYFKEAANYADAETSACPMCGNVNPEIVLNIIDEKALNNNGELSDERKMTPQEWHELYLKYRNEHNEDLGEVKVSDVPHSDQRKPGVLKQFAIFLHRNFKTKITNIQYLCITLLEAPLLAVVCSYLTRYAPPEGYTVMDNKNLVSYFFMAVIVATFIGMSGSAEEIIKDRALLKRESFLHLSYGSYIWSKIVYMAGVSLLQTLLFIVIGNAIMGIHGLFWTWWIILFVTAFLANLTGLLLSQCLNSVVAIYISIPMLLIPQILLCGLVVSFSDLTPKSTTGNVPLIGDLIPSRWSYEALAVTSFTDNEYERNFFELDKEKYETQYYNMGLLYELQSQLETQKDEQRRGKTPTVDHMQVIHTNLPLVTAYCGMEPYKGDDSYRGLYHYMKEAERILSRRSNAVTLKADRLVSDYIHENGKEALLQLKRENFNTKLEDCVIGADQKRMLDVIDGVAVPRTGIIFLTPQSTVGRAPFYSSEKILGSWHVKTIWFNMAVLLLMCIVMIILLQTDCVGKLLRKQS